MVKVELRADESQESLLRRFRRKVTREHVLSAARQKRFYMSDSEKRRLARRKAERRERRRAWKENGRQGEAE